MAWVSIRSRRAPACWAPLVAVSLLALLLGLSARLLMTSHVRALETLAQADPDAAALAAERTLRSLVWSVSGFCGLASVLMARYFQLGLRQGRLPPSGWWSLGAHRAATGATARRLGRLGLALAFLLALLGLGSAVYGHATIDMLLRVRVAAQPAGSLGAPTSQP